ncbi:hypothetical protein [Metapseudomonas otitidis]|uniref:hypothetical protein n=1 Tax=Metapseudomonas otitidis TaxID=319939 RepID=UPI00262E2507|nr:hypothetical protein [Pseudomonas otitidis]
MSNHFFNSTKTFTDQLSEIFDFTWSTSAALWNLRWQVKGLLDASPTLKHDELLGRFLSGSDIRGANLKRSCLETTWEEQKELFAKITLSEIFALYEAWAKTIYSEANLPLNKASALEFESGGQSIRALPISPYFEKSIFPQLEKHKKYDPNRMNNHFTCYRFFKEMRNCLIHHGGIPHETLLTAYQKFSALHASDIGAKQIPEHDPVVRGQKIKLSLRGVVGFGDIALKLMVTIDAEIAKSTYAEKYFTQLWKNTHPMGLTLPKDPKTASNFIKRHISKLEIPSAKSVMDLKPLLVRENLITPI